MEFFHGPRAQTTNTDLAAALGTLGIPRNAEQPLQVLIGDVDQVCFYFEEFSTCGTYQTGAMIRAWDDADTMRTLPRHALTYMRYALHSRKRLLDYAKNRMRIGIAGRPGGQLEVVRLPDGASPTRRLPAPHVPVPDAATTPRLQTDDLELAACLLACGVPLWRDMPLERHGQDRISFFFQPASPCGQFQTRALMLAWQDPQWHVQHPEHPFAYLSCAMENRKRLLREVRSKNPMVVFLRAGYPQFLSLNADSKVESTFMQELAKL